jgi:hypothetical protein
MLGSAVIRTALAREEGIVDDISREAKQPF